MSHNYSALRSSQSSRRYSPYSRPPASASAHPSPLPSNPHHTTPSSEHDAAKHPSEDDVPPASIYSHSSTSTALHSSTSSMTEYPLVPLVSNSQDNHTTQPSTSTRRLEPSSYQYNWWPQPIQRSELPFSQGPSHPPAATNITYTDRQISIPIDSLLNPQQPSIGVSGPEDSTHQKNSVWHRPPQGQLSTRQGQTYCGEGLFKNSHNFAVTNSIFVDNNTTSDSQFMEKLLQHTIIGAEFDSSDRHPPPRCHPGTRLAIIERCKMFIVQCEGKEKMRWVVGPAGVGKSAIMQIVAEEIPADASVFFSVNGRQDGTKTFITIAYQLAAKCKPYRQFIRNEIGRDPSFLRKSLPVHFQTFIVEPFIHWNLLDPAHRYLVILDGLDECDNRLVQQELLGLISRFCISYPTSPIVWFVASRPEPHITAFFGDIDVAPAYTKEEILIDSDEACEEVQRYLRDELNGIKNTYPTLKRKREWPSEFQFTKIATAAGGLFAYASTVVRYIGDLQYQDPAAQLRRLLEVIDAGSNDDVSGRDHPMAQLDALYRRILFNIPPDAMINARKLLLINADGWSVQNFRYESNRLGLSEDAAYGAVRHLHAVMKVPTPDEADNENLEFFHKSFLDFLCDGKRSGFSPNVEDEAGQLLAQSLFRIVQQVPDTFDDAVSGGGVKCHGCGYMKDGPGFCNNILLSWPGDERFPIVDGQLKLDLYLDAIRTMCNLFESCDNLYHTMSWFHVLTMRFIESGSDFPFYELRDSAFEQFRPELTELGKLKQVSLRALDYAAICGRIDLRFTSYIGTDLTPSNPWNASCKHEKRQLDDLPQRRGWSTVFQRICVCHRDGDKVAQTSSIPRFHIKAGGSSHWESTYNFAYGECIYCLRRLARHFIDNPDQLATVFIDSTQLSYVELSFQDPDDGVSEWRYRFFHSGPPSCVD